MTTDELIRELEETAAWLDERAAAVERIGAVGRMKERLNKEATIEAARLRGRAVVIRQTVIQATAPPPPPPPPVPTCKCDRCGRQLFSNSCGNYRMEDGVYKGVCYACLRPEED